MHFRNFYITTLFILIFAHIDLSAQNKTRTDTIIDIHMGCGIAGDLSSELCWVRDLIKVKNDTDLVKLVFSTNITLKFLTIVAIENISKTRAILLSDEQIKVIQVFKTKKDKVYGCVGCEMRYVSTINKIFKKPDQQLRRCINRHLGQSENNL